MKCEIIRVLLPSYVDGLTSTESNEAIENHLEYCLECQEYLESMKKEITGEREVLEKDIDPFIRIKRETARKVVIAVILTAIISALGIEYYREYVYHGKSVMSDEVAISHEEDDNVKALKFRTYDENSIVTVGYAENEPVNGKMPLETNRGGAPYGNRFKFILRKYDNACFKIIRRKGHVRIRNDRYTCAEIQQCI